MCAAIAQIDIKECGSYRYEGQVNQHGERHGKGVLSYSNGHRYEGEFRNNRWHGHGTYYDGRVKSGKWENSKFLG